MSYKFVFLLILISGMGALLFYYSINRMADPNPDNFENKKMFLSNQMLVVLVLTFALLLATYYTVRNNFHLIEIDSARLTIATQAMDRENTLIPSKHFYQHGYAYQAFVLLIAKLTDLPIFDIQTTFLPFIGMLILVPAAISFFYAISKDWLISIVSTLIILVQPDFLFAIFRGSHEKLDWPLLMISIVLLLESTKHPNIKKIKYIFGFYLIIFAKIATNVFFASNFIFAFLISLFIGGFLLMLGKVRSVDGKNIGRLIYISLTSFVLLFSFFAYIYPPAIAMFRNIPTIIDKITVLFFSMEFQENPYEYINIGWIDPRVYWVLSSYTWLIIVLSLAEWFRGGIEILIKGNEKEFWKIIDWFLYAGFAVQIFFSIIVDLSGALTSNMQLRVLPGFVIFASILLVKALKRLLAKENFQGKLKNFVLIPLSIMFGVFVSLALIKSSLEPTLSNQWISFSETEATGINWIENSFTETSIWTGVDSRLYSIFLAKNRIDSNSNNDFRNWGLEFAPDVDYLLLSNKIYILYERLTNGLLVLKYPIIYDNGDVKIFKVE